MEAGFLLAGNAPRITPAWPYRIDVLGNPTEQSVGPVLQVVQSAIQMIFDLGKCFGAIDAVSVLALGGALLRLILSSELAHCRQVHGQ